MADEDNQPVEYADAPGMQTQDMGTDAATDAATSTEATEAAPGPTVTGLATPMHVEPSADVMAQRMAPDVGRGAARPVLTTTPIIGAVEGNIPMPDTSNMIAYPWAQMGVGDSFEVGHGMTCEALMDAAGSWAEEAGAPAKFQAHVMANGIRVWRIA